MHKNQANKKNRPEGLKSAKPRHEGERRGDDAQASGARAGDEGRGTSRLFSHKGATEGALSPARSYPAARTAQRCSGRAGLASATVSRPLARTALAAAAPGSHVQLERLGYFYADPVTSKDGALVWNRTTTLRDTWAKVQKKS